MRSRYKNKDLLKNQPFYSSEIKSDKKNDKKISDISILSELPFFLKEPKELTNKQLSDVLPFQPKWKKWSKWLTKHQILTNILRIYDSVGIVRSEHAQWHAAETYNVEITDTISIDDSLFLAKRGIHDLFRDLLKEKRGFKYNLDTKFTLKRWNNATNSYDIKTIYITTNPITVTNRRIKS